MELSRVLLLSFFLVGIHMLIRCAFLVRVGHDVRRDMLRVFLSPPCDVTKVVINKKGT